MANFPPEWVANFSPESVANFNRNRWPTWSGIRIEDFHFRDGGSFDFRGNENRTINGTEGTLANSNQRDTKGFATTYEFERTLGVLGKMKLDWILVKAYLKDARDDSGTYRFAPHFARTLASVNYALANRLSDHDPISVDLPFGEPGQMSGHNADNWRLSSR